MSKYHKFPMDRRHLDYCTSEKQVLAVELRLSGKSLTEIAEATGQERSNLSRIFRDLYFRASQQGYDPEAQLDAPIPDSLALAGVTNLYKMVDGERILAQQYVMGRKASKENDIASVIDAIDSACNNIKPAAPIKAPKNTTADLLNLVHCTDYHLAAYAAHEEGGADWDMSIAKNQFVKAMTELVSAAPDAETGIFSQGGDFLHYDSLEALTPANKHLLDADGRAFKMVQLALEMHIFAVEHMLAHHKKVVVIVQEGNHDPMSSIWLRKALIQYFKKNKRVEILDVEFPFYAHLHGEIMLAFHHGHKVRNKSLPALFASEPRYREMWGKAKYCYIHTGHYHQREQDMSEYGGAIVERHPTLAARDAYAARGGYVSWRAMNCITYHKSKGEISRRTTVPDVEL